jgi:hypothetical protein
MQIIERAANASDFDLERVGKLLELKERWETAENARAFASAMVAFKRNPPHIVKNKAVAFGNTKYNHATLDEVSEKIAGALAAHGISHSWSTSQLENRITVTCKLMHASGHTESVELYSESDKSGAKNSIQAIGSAVTYLERYTLLAITGLSTSEITDDDGRSTAPGLDDSAIHADVWVALEDAARDEGTDALRVAWLALTEDTRNLISANHSERWANIKAIAALKTEEAATGFKKKK